MMKPSWVFEKDVFDADVIDGMIRYCRDNNTDYTVVDHVVFGNDDHVKWKFPSGTCVIAYGSIGFVKAIQSKKAWYPGSWCNWHNLKCSTYLSHWGQYSIHRQYCLLPLAEVNRLKEHIYARFGINGHVFIRPDTNDKIFHGERVAYENFERWYDVAQIYGPEPTQLVLISSPSQIVQECRMVIASGKVVTGSHYKTSNVTRSVLEDHQLDLVNATAYILFAEDVVSKWMPDSIFTLDICLCNDNRYYVLECGSVNCSGLYKCDLPLMMRAAEKQAISDWEQSIE